MLSHLKAYAENERIVLGHKQSTVDKYVRDIKQFHGWLLSEKKDSYPDGVTAQDIKDFMIALVFKFRCKENTTRAAKLSAIRSFFDYLVNAQYLRLSPCQDIPHPKIVKGLPTKFTTKELAKIFSMFPVKIEDPWQSRDHAILKVMYAAGLRVSELSGLSLEDLNDTNRYIRLNVIGKGGKPRVITLKANPAAALRTWMVFRLGMITEHTALFISRRHKERLKPAAINEVLKKYSVKVGIRDMDAFVHKMRATCFADMYDAQMNKCHACGAAWNKEDIYTLAAFAGHSDPKTMQAYIDISDTVQKRGIPEGRFTEIGKIADGFRREREATEG